MDGSGLISWFGDHYSLAINVASALITAVFVLVVSMGVWHRLTMRLPSRVDDPDYLAQQE